MNADLRTLHYGRGTVVVGACLLSLALVYMVQVAGAVRHTRDLVATDMVRVSPDGTVQLDLRRLAIYDFFVTREAWALAHLWLLWVLVVQVARRPLRHLRVVRGVAAGLAFVVVVTWAMRVWLAGHGTSA